MAKKDLRDLDDLSADDLLRRLESSEPQRKKRRLQIEEEPGAEDGSFTGFGEDGEDVQADSGESDGSLEGSGASSEIESTEIRNDGSLSWGEQIEERDDKPGIPSRASNEQAPRTFLPRYSRALGGHQSLDSSTTKSSFAELGASKALVASLASMSIRTPTEVQAACIPPLLAGKDCVGNAKTGSGKTIAFALPILQKLSVDPYGVYALVLTPTRELAFQISEQFAVLGAPLTIQTAVIVGGMDMIAQAIELNNRPHVVVATPGRIVDHLKSSSGEWDLSRVKFLVLDEADRLLTPSFASELAYLFNVLPKERQTCLFTATMTESIEELIAAPPRPGKQKPFVHRMTAPVETVETLEQFYLLVPSHVREPYLFYLLCNPPDSIIHLRRAPPEPAKSSKKARTKSSKARKASTDDQDVLEQPPPTMIFCARARTAAYLATLLRTLGIRSTALHSRLTQRARLNALGLFRARVVPVLICTDVGARGLDVDDVALVVNWDMPQEPEEYTHRVGRTARRGRTGLAVSFVTERDEDRVIRVEGRIKTKLKEMTLPEERVLEKLNAVATAKRLANMELHDSEFGKREEIRNRKMQHAK
ncbi:DBP8 [Sanghuangporus vaninii]